MKKEYNFNSGVRGKYYQKYLSGTSLIKLDPELQKAFPTSEHVNQALKALLLAFEPKKKIKLLETHLTVRIGPVHAVHRYGSIAREPSAENRSMHSLLKQWPLAVVVPLVTLTQDRPSPDKSGSRNRARRWIGPKK